MFSEAANSHTFLIRLRVLLNNRIPLLILLVN